MSRPGLFAAGVAAYLAALLYADRFVALSGQVALGVVTAAVLVAVLLPLPRSLRAQTLVVVAVATVGEVIGSIVWGLYTYRLENLPAFVPPAHGLVYLAGVALSACFPARGRLLVGGALAAVLAWGAAGVTVLPRADVAGALGALALAVVLLRGRAPAIYAGVFVVVAGLELYGTALGTWAWATTAPGTAISQGNPPSGIAAGYVVFDVAALALAPLVLAVVGRVRSVSGVEPRPPARRSQTGPALPVPDPARSA